MHRPSKVNMLVPVCHLHGVAGSLSKEQVAKSTAPSELLQPKVINVMSDIGKQVRTNSEKR